MNQGELLLYIQNSNKPVTLKELKEHFGVDKPNVTRQLNKMNNYGFIDIQVKKRGIWEISARKTDG